jgi:hypothetical protein
MSSKMRPFYLCNSSHCLISRTRKKHRKFEKYLFYPLSRARAHARARTHTHTTHIYIYTYITVTLHIHYSATYFSYQNKNRRSISHKSKYRATWLRVAASHRSPDINLLLTNKQCQSFSPERGCTVNERVQEKGQMEGQQNYLMCAFFWVIPRRLNRQSVPKRRHIKFRRRGITQKKAHNIQNTAKV